MTFDPPGYYGPIRKSLGSLDLEDSLVFSISSGFKMHGLQSSKLVQKFALLKPVFWRGMIF